MPIDTSVTGSPGWWLNVLATKLADRTSRIRSLRAYMDGNAPLPEGAEGCTEAYKRFQRFARTNFAELVVEAVQERMVPTGFRTGADGDENGDAEARKIWNGNDLDIFAPDVHGSMLGLSDAYVIVGPPEEGGDVPVITPEDPELMITAHDPRRPQKIIAALKLFRDDVLSLDFAYLYLPGQVFVATRRAENTNITDDFEYHSNPQITVAGWEWDERLSQSWPTGFEDVIPVARFRNRRGLGEFETHTDIIDRINYIILQRLVIAAMQAYRQRATKGDLPEVDEAGETIDYATLFRPGPGALWRLPEGVDLWESSPTDLGPLLIAAKDDIRDLAAVTRTPMSMLLPDGQNQTAEGAAFAREGLVFKTQDRIKRASYGWNRVMSLAFRFAGDDQRASVLDLETLWAPPERLTLAERADAAQKAQNDFPWRSRMAEIWGMSPEAIARMEAERVNDAMLAASLAPALSQPETAGEPVADGDDDA